MMGQRIVDAALSYVGTPFRHQGRVPHVGLDCAGLCICAARDAGLAISDWTSYGTPPNPNVLMRELEHRCVLVTQEWMPGDILLFNRRWTLPMHFAIYDGEGGMIHALAKSGTTHQPIGTTYRKRLHSVWRWKGVLWPVS